MRVQEGESPKQRTRFVDSAKGRPNPIEVSKQEYENLSDMMRPDYFNVFAEKDELSSTSKKRIRKNDNSDLDLLFDLPKPGLQASGSFSVRFSP